ncbi:MAG: hypothetical protein LUC50_02995 [Ruminococcus sp.]|nr:hypothetical protein [Ruminococcus sp.]
MQDTKNDFYRDIVITLEYIETKETLFCTLNNYCSIGALSDLVSNSLAQAIKEHLMRNEISCDTQAASLTFTCQMLSDALIHGISWWLNHKEFYTKYEVIKQFYAFFTDVIEK